MTTDDPAPPVSAESRRAGRHPLAEVRAALGLLTRLPAGDIRSDRTGAKAFGVVGAIVGAIAAVPLVVLGGTEPGLAAILAVALLAVASGALHLDGLADTADALLAGDPVRAEVARKDPNVGVGGVVAIVLVLAAEVAALASVAADAGLLVATLACIAAATVSRSVSVVAAWWARDRVGPSGLGVWFTGHLEVGDVVVVILSAGIVVAALCGIASLMVPVAVGGLALGIVIGAGVGFAIAAAVIVARRRLDGDGLGAGVELAQTAVLVAIAGVPLVG